METANTKYIKKLSILEVIAGLLSLKDQPLNLFRWLEILNSSINTNSQFMLINLHWIMTHSQYFLICSWAWVFGLILMRVRFLIPRSLLRVLEIVLFFWGISNFLPILLFFSFLIVSCCFFLSFQNFNICARLSLQTIFFAFGALTLFLSIMALTFLL